MEISQANRSDSNILARVCGQTFREAYAEFNRAEDIDFYIANHFTAEHLIIELTDPDSVFFVARDGAQIVGYCKLKIHHNQQPPALEIARLYVYANYYGKALGAKLLKQAILWANNHGFNSLKLLVWKENKRAISFYLKSGFEIVDQAIFDWGTGKLDQDWIMVKAI